MNKISTLATHNITEENNFGFSAKEYSKFKFGSSKIGQLFGDELFEKLIDLKESELSSYKKIYVFTSPYDFIPTATNTIFESFFDKLSKHLTSKCVVEKRKIHRNTTYTNDYGALSKDQRMKLISNDSFKLKNDFEGNELLIFLDDIKITGSHEFVVKKTLKENRIKNDVFFIYHAILDNNNIDPTFENYLNYSYVKGVNEIQKIYNESDFVLNTRFTKYILQLNNNEINYFLSCVKKDGLEAIILASKGNKYDKIPEYFKNLKKIIKLHSCLTTKQTDA
jgi:hypothetical protein